MLSVSCFSKSLHLSKIHEDVMLNNIFFFKLGGNFKVSMINMNCMKFTKSGIIRFSYVDMKKIVPECCMLRGTYSEFTF